MGDYREYGLEPVPAGERRLGGWEMAAIWGGISFCLPTFMLGALPVPGLAWGDALLVNVLGNLVCAVLIGLAGYGGVRHGLPAVKLAERVLGPLWGRGLASLLVTFSTAGWFAALLAMTVDGLAGVLALEGYRLPLAVGLGAGMTLTAALGHSKLLLWDKVALPLLCVVMAWYAAAVFPDAPPLWSVAYPPTGEVSFGAVFNLIVAGYIAGAFCASDFSRYAASLRANWWGTLAGVFAVSLLLSVLAMYAKLLSGDWNPIRAVHSTGLGLAAVLVIVLSAWTTNHALAYSAGLALANLRGVRHPKTLTALAGAVATAAAAAGWADRLEPFLNQLGLVFPPVLGVFLARYFLVLRQELTGPPARAAHLGLAVLAGLTAAALLPEEYSAMAGLAAGGGGYWLAAGWDGGRRTEAK